MVLSDKGDKVLSVWEGSLSIWDVKTGTQIGRSISLGERVMAATFSPDGRFIAAGDAAARVKLWSASYREIQS